MNKLTNIDRHTDEHNTKRPYVKPVLVEIDFKITEGKYFAFSTEFSPSSGPAS